MNTSFNFYEHHIFICLKVILIDQKRKKKLPKENQQVVTDLWKAYVTLPNLNEFLASIFT